MEQQVGGPITHGSLNVSIHSPLFGLFSQISI